MVWQFLLTLAMWIIFQIVIKEKPHTPPSAVSEVIPESLNFKQSLQVLRENQNFLLLLIAYSVPFGSFMAAGAVLSNVFDPFGFTPSEVSFISLGLLTTGVVGAVTVGAFLDKFKMYKISMILASGVVVILTALLST